VDEQAVNGFVAVIAAVAGLMAKGGWDFLKLRRSDHAAVKTAQIADGTAIRKELWAEIDKLRADVRTVQTELAAARADTAAAMKANIELLGEHMKLKAEHDALKREYDALVRRYQAAEQPTGPAVVQTIYPTGPTDTTA
jgi:outer membrane murein-binding lipoprotein Lpp